MFVYILKLEEDKYYIGKTTNPDVRIRDHFNSRGAKWTQKYKPVETMEIIPDCDDYDENKHTFKMMKIYGIENVRGGSFCQVVLSQHNINTLNQILFDVSNKCYTCGSTSHYTLNCRNKLNVDGKCNCITSQFSKHRKSKCLLTSILYFEI
jgi:predicted GIY-YIG superfamily endonuclease